MSLEYRENGKPIPEKLLKLDALLRIAGIPHETTPWICGGEITLQISAPSKKNQRVDAVCHQFSYGGGAGLLEVLGSVNPDAPNDDVVGWLTAADALKYFISSKY